MDWATFFKDNSQSLFTLGGVFLGSLITFVINHLNLRNQSRERDKDREEQRREAKTQLEIELAKKDINVVEKNINNELMTMEFINDFLFRRARHNMSSVQAREMVISALYSPDGRLSKLSENTSISDKIAGVFGEEFSKEYGHFFQKTIEYQEMVIDWPSNWKERAIELNKEVMKSASELHFMLREKLISVRDN